MAALRATTSSLLALLAAAAAVVLLLAPAPIAAQLLSGTILITGTVPCTVDPTTIATAPAAPVFPNASVLLQCGRQVISSTTSNDNGAFAMPLSILSNLATWLEQLLNGCKVVIATPLSACNASLPTTGTLQSTLQFLDRGLLGRGRMLGPLGFSFIK